MLTSRGNCSSLEWVRKKLWWKRNCKIYDTKSAFNM